VLVAAASVAATENPFQLVEFGFMNVNLATARNVELPLDETPRTGREVLEKVSVELQSVDIDAVIRAGLQILNRLVERDVITGTKLERCC
jgi:hypothetical protein